MCVPIHEQVWVLKVEPGRAPERIALSNTLEAFQAAVGGDIEILGLDGGAVLVCNEQGKCIGLRANRQVGDKTIAGTFLIAGSADGEFRSLSRADTARFTQQFTQSPPNYGDQDELTQWSFFVL